MDNNTNENLSNPVITAPRYIFWLNNPAVLYENENYTKFVPSSDMTRVEQLNAITRFCIYSIILLFIFNKDNTWFYIPFVILILTIIFYYIYELDPEGRRKELIKERSGKNKVEPMNRTDSNNLNYKSSYDNSSSDTNILKNPPHETVGD